MSLYQTLVSGKCFFLIAGPCVVETEEITMHTATVLKSLCEKYEIPFVFKASYRKANRSNIQSFMGIGDIEALQVLKKVKEKLQIPIITDIHLPDEALVAANYADMLQIPAFLCRQTDILLAAGKTNLPVNIKKGQFLSPQSMIFAANKVKSTGNNNILLTERGTTFGYDDLIVDFRSIPVMKRFGYPVVLDCTHSLQQPNRQTGETGGLPEFIPEMAKAGIAVGANGLFIETHPEPAKALSDGANMLPLNKMESLLQSLVKIYKAIND